ncbi:MAG: YncE family protein [Candidatus Aminicenantes bacterium]|jgi:DNA-binding beta-propeller fold protein YncE
MEAKLTYSCHPTQVGLSTATTPNYANITFTVRNESDDVVDVEQINFNIPEGQDETDLIAPNSAGNINTGNVHSSNGSTWTLSGDTNGSNVFKLTPLTGTGKAVMANGDYLTFTLSHLQINQAGAGQSAVIQVCEINADGKGSAVINIEKVEVGFQIQEFTSDLYNVNPGDPVTISWKVIGALSIKVSADILSTAAEFDGPGENTCNGQFSNIGFDDQHTCTIQGATLFTLTARGPSGGQDINLTSQLLITVNEAMARFNVPAIHDIYLGESFPLGWVSANAGTLYLSAEPGDKSGLPNPLTDLTDTPIGEKKIIPGPGKFTYNLDAYVARHANPNQHTTAHDTTEVLVKHSRLIPGSFKAKSTSVKGGEKVILSWKTENVPRCKLQTSDGFVDENAPLNTNNYPAFAINSPVVYTLTAYGKVHKDVATVKVKVIDPKPVVISTVDASPGGTLALAVNPDGTRLYVGGNYSEYLLVVDTAKAKSDPANAVLTKVPLGGNPIDLVVKPDGSRVYVAIPKSRDAGSIVVIDTTKAETNPDQAVVSTVPLDIITFNLAIQPDGARVYASNGYRYDLDLKGYLAAIDTNMAETQPDKAVQFKIYEHNCKLLTMAVQPDSSRVYTATRDAYNLKKLFMVMNTKTRHTSLAGGVPDSNLYPYPNDVAVNLEGTRLYVATSDGLWVFDTKTYRTLSTSPVPGAEYTGVSVSSDNSYVYGSRNDLFVVINAEKAEKDPDNAVVTTLPLKNLSGMAVNPSSGLVYLAYGDSTSNPKIAVVEVPKNL